MKSIQLAAVAGMVLLTGCVVGPNYTRPAVAVPESYATSARVDHAQHFIPNKDIPAQWWALFHSKALNDLVIESFRHNPSVSVAQETLHGALENAYAQQGALFPYVGLSFSPAAQQTAALLTSVLASNKYVYGLYTGQGFVSYTPDVFGGTRRQIESLMAQAESQQFQLEATYLTLASNVVNAAIQEAALRGQIDATKRMIASQKSVLAITYQQYSVGGKSQADIALQEAALAANEAALPPIEKQLALQRDLLNALTGRLPDDVRTPKFTLQSLHLPGELPISLPSCLIEHRPDIRAAEAQMRSANALIGVAISNRLPNVTIGFTNAGTTATSLSTLFQTDTIFWSLAGIVAQPVFDGGTLKHRQRLAEAIYKQTVAQYQSTVINAFQNVSDTLKSIRIDAVALNTASRAERAALKSLGISRQQYKSGDTSMLVTLTNEQLYQQTRLNLIQAQANRLSDTAALFQALGGGWWVRPSKTGGANNSKIL